MSKLVITDLDFKKISDNLKNYLRGRDEFKDYDFNASGLSTLIDLLSYNTLYNAFYSNMVGAEMFLDSAQLRESVVSNAKHLNYVPRSVRSARAFIDITFNSPGVVSSISIPRGTAFSSRGGDGELYTFTTTTSVVVYPDGFGSFFIENLEIIEGARLVHRFNVDYSGPDKPRFILPNANVDVTDLIVRVQEGPNSNILVSYKRASDINELTSTDRVYFLQEIEDGLFEIYFGDDVIGMEPDNGSVVVVDYVVSNGENANGAFRFAPINGVGGYASSTVTITTRSKAGGGAEAESNDSIKLLAPLNWEAQDRAVTKQDYETLIKKDNPQIEFVRVWGGEDNNPPQYGRIFASLKPIDGVLLSASQKQKIIQDIVKQRNIVSLEIVLVEPEYTYVMVNTLVGFKSSLTNKTSGDIKQLVINAIDEYRDTELAGFDKKFRSSKLTRSIDSADESILNSLTTFKMKMKILPPLNVPTQFVVSYNNPIDRGDATNSISTLESSPFIYKGQVSYFGDDGQGNIYIYRIFVNQKVIFERGIGTIDYDNGIITLNSFAPDAIPNSETINLIVQPQKNDLFSERNQVFLLEPSDISVTVTDETTGLVI